MMKRITLLMTALAFAVSCQSVEQAPPDNKATGEKPAHNFYPAQTGEVNDFEGILSSTEETMLTERILKVQDSLGIDLIIVTVDSIPQDMAIVLYATELGNQWNIGSDDKKNGLVIVLSNGSQQVGIATGQGIEEQFNDQVTGRIINQEMLPQFSVGEPFRGLMKGINALLTEKPEKAPSALEN